VGNVATENSAIKSNGQKHDEYGAATGAQLSKNEVSQAIIQQKISYTYFQYLFRKIV
jgi:hypothetical protein